jgi:hypothetical protein
LKIVDNITLMIDIKDENEVLSEDVVLNEENK